MRRLGADAGGRLFLAAQRTQDRRDDPRGGEARLFVLNFRFFMIDKDVRQGHGAEFHATIEQARRRQIGHYLGGKTADRSLFHGHEHFMLAGQAMDQVCIERFGEARIGDGRAQSMAGEILGRAQALLQAPTIRKQRHGCTLAQDPALADLQRLATHRHIDTHAFAARIAERRRAIIDRRGGGNHVDQFGLVGRRHQHKTRQAAEIGDVESAVMGRAIGTDQTGAIDREAHRQLLDRDIMDHLVIAALEEGRIDRRKGFETLGREAGGEGSIDPALIREMGEEGDLPAKIVGSLSKAVPIGRMAQPDEIAYGVTVFTAEDANYITGQTLSVSGGLTMSD